MCYTLINRENETEEYKMKAGETICYYRARGGSKSVYITMLYDKNQLRGSIIQNVKPESKLSFMQLGNKNA